MVTKSGHHILPLKPVILNPVFLFSGGSSRIELTPPKREEAEDDRSPKVEVITAKKSETTAEIQPAAAPGYVTVDIPWANINQQNLLTPTAEIITGNS